MSKLVCFILSFILFISSIGLYGVKISEASTRDDLCFDNTIVFTVSSENDRVFTTGDFQEIKCKKLLMISKTKYDKIFYYTFIAILTESGEVARNTAKENIILNKSVNGAEGSNKYLVENPYIILDSSVIYLHVGETVELKMIKHEDFDNTVFTKSFSFIVDSEKYTGSLNEHTFNNYAQSGFVQQNYSSSGNEYSYSGMVESGDVKDYILLADSLLRSGYVMELTFERSSFPAAQVPIETWSVSNSKIATISMKDGSSLSELYFGKKEYRTCVIQAKKAGTTTVDVERQGSVQKAYASCTVKVLLEGETVPEPTVSPIPTATAKPTATPSFSPEVLMGDVDNNSYVDARDALELLKFSAKLKSFNSNQKIAADLNSDNIINAEDALEILKIASRLK